MSNPWQAMIWQSYKQLILHKTTCCWPENGVIDRGTISSGEADSSPWDDPLLLSESYHWNLTRYYSTDRILSVNINSLPGGSHQLCYFSTFAKLIIFYQSFGTDRSQSKHCRPRSDATECGIWSGPTLLATHPAVCRRINGLSNFKTSRVRSYGVTIFRANMAFCIV